MIEYEYSAERKVVSTRASGAVDLGQFSDYFETMLADPRIEAGFIEIFDASAVSDFTFGYRDTDFFPAVWARYLAKGVRVTIVLAPTELEFGILRMIAAVIEARIGSVIDNFHVVRRESEVEDLLALHSPVR